MNVATFLYVCSMENKQNTHHFLMVRPATFEVDSDSIQSSILLEFDTVIDVLRKHGVSVLAVDDTKNPNKPKAIFASHWLSTHANGHVILYPLLEKERRLERSKEILSQLEKEFVVKQYHHLEQYEANNRFLEGTGSIVFDRANKVAYGCTSAQTDATLLDKLCKEIEYQPASFRATDKNEQAVYHTNMMMMVADEFAVVCMEAVQDGADELLLKQLLRTTKKHIINISRDQMYSFAGNMLEISTKDGSKFTLMSDTAKNALSKRQLEQIQSFNPIFTCSIPNIEKFLGGGIRSMLVELFLKRR